MKIPFVFIMTGHSNSGKTHLEKYASEHLLSYTVNIISSIDPYKKALRPIIERDKDEEKYRNILSQLKGYNGIKLNTLMLLDEILSRCNCLCHPHDQPIFFVDIREPEHILHMKKCFDVLGIPTKVIKVTSYDEKIFGNDSDIAEVGGDCYDVCFHNYKTKNCQGAFLALINNFLDEIEAEC